PHLIYVPERVFDPDKFLAAVDQAYKTHGRCVVAVSEGIVDATGKPVILGLRSDTETDSHGNVQLSGSGALGDGLADLVKSKLKIKRVRSDTFGYLQRSFLSVVSTADANEAREVGEKAVQYSVWHNVDGSVAIRRTGDYSVDYFLTELSTVARHTKHMPDNFLIGDADVSTSYLNYARPLIGNFPHYERIAAPSVQKFLDR
ncbi:MAG: hypothetical protein FWD57_05145, partial [Polyangiaceae bacterium]|nr:hypothetical protein [Polyangiaceae bacterium]